MRSLEAQGVPSKQAEAITSAITEVLNDSLENVSESFVSKAEMQKVLCLLFSIEHYLIKKKGSFLFLVLLGVSLWVQIEMIQDSNLSKFKSEVKSSQVTTYTGSCLLSCIWLFVITYTGSSFILDNLLSL